MDKGWVDGWLTVLDLLVKTREQAGWSLFGPTPDFYEKLQSGDDGDLRSATAQVGKHLGITCTPSVRYEWGLKMNPDAAGQIAFRDTARSRIQIPLFYVGKPYPLGAIIAHELTHEVLALQLIPNAEAHEREPLTDLASIALGLGKLVLNGTVHEAAPSTGEVGILGYLDLHLKGYAYRRVNEHHHVPESLAAQHLADDALRILETS